MHFCYYAILIDRQHFTIPNQRPKDKHYGISF